MSGPCPDCGTAKGGHPAPLWFALDAHHAQTSSEAPAERSRGRVYRANACQGQAGRQKSRRRADFGRPAPDFQYFDRVNAPVLTPVADAVMVMPAADPMTMMGRGGGDTDGQDAEGDGGDNGLF